LAGQQLTTSSVMVDETTFGTYVVLARGPSNFYTR